MTFTRLFKTSIGVAALTGSLLATNALAQAPYSAPTPDQYAAQNPQYANQSQGQNGDPNGQYAAPQQDNSYAPIQNGAPQAGAPQGITQAPPEIPDYQQPEAPGDGYIWTPGYWAWTGDGYEWVQGAWVAAPYTGALWTPGYWGYGYGGYFWNAGYWGPYVGYYGGINYGFGYFGIGFYGGYWGGGRFFYNRAYCNYHGGFGYSRAYSGYSGRPGGSSFVRGTAIAANRGAAGAAGNGFRGSAVNGRTAGFTQAASRSSYNGSVNNGARSFAGGSNYSSGARSYSQPSQSYGGGARSYSAPSGGSFHGSSAPSGGGGFHGGGGGGGGSHGGGGGHR